MCSRAFPYTFARTHLHVHNRCAKTDTHTNAHAHYIHTYAHAHYTHICTRSIYTHVQAIKHANLANLMPVPFNMLHNKWMKEPSAKVPKQSCR
jgi:hypothetical protein